MLACRDDIPPPPELDRAAAEAAAERLAAQQVSSPSQPAAAPAAPVAEARPDVEPVQVVLVWQGISSLYKGFFSDRQATGALSLGLAGTVTEPANIYVRYDSVEFLGSIRLQLRPDTLRLVVRHKGDLLLLSDLAPVTRALAAYRSAVASHYDVRVESFRVGIESFRGPTSCIFGVAGTPPPDGSLVSPCVEVDGIVHCGRPEAGGIRFEPGVARAVRRCLDL